MPATIVAAFGAALWLGLYLIARNPAKAVTVRAGAGLVAYAGALACELFTGAWAERAQYVLAGVPALAWTGALIGLVPSQWRSRRWFEAGWRYGVVPSASAALGTAAAVGGWAYAGAALIVLAPLAAALVLVVLHARLIRPVPVGGLFVPATLLFGLGATALIIPFGWMSTRLLLAGVGFDFAVLGVAVARFDAFDEGESFLADLGRSFVATAATALVFGIQTGLAVRVGGASVPLLSLWLATVATAVVLVVFAGRFQDLLDRIVFAGAPAIRSERGQLRSVSEALPRRAAPELAEMDDEEFARLTRQALRHYSDLGKLASNPLTGLPLVDKRLAERGAAENSLERAREFKALLLECVVRLKPPEGEFGTTDEWRHYSALYFFYVVNIRPYRNHPDTTGLDESARQALRWFRRYVPQRTLHNWQRAATGVVAMDLRSRGWG